MPAAIVQLVILLAAIAAAACARTAPPPPAEPPPAAPAAATPPAPADDDPARAQRRRELDARRRAALAAPGGATVSQADRRRLHEEARGVSITMYSTTWCPVCRQARAFFQQNGLAFTERDVEKDRRALAAALRLNPNGSVPTISVDGRVLVGFDPGALRAAIEVAARSRIR